MEEKRKRKWVAHIVGPATKVPPKPKKQFEKPPKPERPPVDLSNVPDAAIEQFAADMVQFIILDALDMFQVCLNIDKALKTETDEEELEILNSHRTLAERQFDVDITFIRSDRWCLFTRLAPDVVIKLIKEECHDMVTGAKVRHKRKRVKESICV